MKNFNKLESYVTDSEGNRIKLGWISTDNQYVISKSIRGEGYDLIPNSMEADYNYTRLHPKDFDACSGSSLKTLLTVYLKLKND